MLKLSNIKSVYLVGIGGIGMSALARYFNSAGLQVGGYDRISTPLTDQLMREGISIHFSDDISKIDSVYLEKESCLVIYTPAIPEEHTELSFYKSSGFRVLKRSEVLGEIMKEKRGIAVAGTHGKTTISTLLAEMLNESEKGCNAFLGGISKNLQSNLVLNEQSEWLVAEADEYDRSFLKLFPEYALVSSADADHLDIYGNHEELKKTFEAFLNQVLPGGGIIMKEGLNLKLPAGIRHFSYHLDQVTADYHAKDICRNGFRYTFSLAAPGRIIEDMELGVYGKVNLENAVGVLALADLLGVEEAAMRKACSNFRGVKRRFDVQVENSRHIYIDDYAHHPAEISAFLNSVRTALPGKELTGIFQPHLYTRTRDFAREFAESLSLLDHVILLDIYPAREKAIEGVSSEIIFSRLTNKGERILCKKEQVFRIIEERKPSVLLTMGAGDIDQLTDGLKEIILK